ncbi:MAG: TniQ family protein [Rhodocyclaceae bacterium]|nr:TniQ family protein [Rhodocyclaceae bacterium]
MAAEASGRSDLFGLKQNAAARLPTHDPEVKLQILSYLTRAAASGLDPIAALEGNLVAWFGSNAGAALPPARDSFLSADSRRLASERLVAIHQPSLWPYRPKRLPGELFSSWLWRLSVASRVAPDKFVRNVPGLRLTDIDRDVAPATLERLSQRTGQTTKHLAAGTINPAFDAEDDTDSAAVEAMLLQDGRCLILRNASAYHNKRLCCINYCPLCLRTDQQPYFRRQWRFNFSIVCAAHGCLLHNACEKCAAPVDLLAQRNARRQPHCATCGEKFSKAKITNLPKHKRQQDRVNAMLLYLGTCIPEAERKVHLDALLTAYRPMPGVAISAKANRTPKLNAKHFLTWFGEPLQPEHIKPLSWLAKGASYDVVLKALHQNVDGKLVWRQAAG